MSTVGELHGTDSVLALAARLNRPGRTRPVVVISVPAAASAPYIDPAEVAEQVGDLAEVYLIRTGQDTWTFTDNMPDRTQVYGGAGRVYPVGTEWVSNHFRSPLRFAFDASQGEEAARALVSDALRMASEAGLVATEMRRSLPRRTGEVRGFPTPERALVRLDGKFAAIVQEFTLPDVPLDRVVAEGMQVSGLYDEHSGRLDVRAELLPASEALRHYGVGDLVLAQVESVDADSARLLLHPEIGVTVRRGDVSSNELDELTSLMTRGEVLTARVTATGPRWALSLIDVEDDEVPVPATSLLPGGPPWLQVAHAVAVAGQAGPDEVDVRAPLPPPPTASTASVPASPTEPEVLPVEPAAETLPTAPLLPTPALLDRRRRNDAAPAPAAPPTTPAPAVRDLSLALDAARAARTTAEEERDRLAAQVAALQGERALADGRIDQLARQREHLERQLEQARTARRRAARRQSRDGDAGDGGPWFLDPEEQFRFEVELAWARRIPAAEKDARPLSAYEIGPDFLASVDALTGVSRDKIVDVVVEVATGLVAELTGRDLHPLRIDEGGNSPQVMRDSDGAAGWRVALQRNTPQARRLHYWQRPDGVIELSRVALHDEYRP